MISLDDTIVAISTPIGTGGIGIVRMTGPDSVRILRQLFVPGPGGADLPIEPRTLHYGYIADPVAGGRAGSAAVIQSTVSEPYSSRSDALMRVCSALASTLAHWPSFQVE